jgi:hypothetical protein
MEPSRQPPRSRVPFPHWHSGVIGLVIAGNPDGHLAPWQDAPGHEITLRTEYRNYVRQVSFAARGELIVSILGVATCLPP